MLDTDKEGRPYLYRVKVYVPHLPEDSRQPARVLGPDRNASQPMVWLARMAEWRHGALILTGCVEERGGQAMFPHDPVTRLVVPIVWPWAAAIQWLGEDVE